MTCVKPVTLKVPGYGPEGLEVPCGKCILCRIKRKKEWAMRMYHELDDYNGNAVFLTLTYKDEYLPENGSLKKQDLQKFFKRLRKQLSMQDRKIRYYAVGEYGDINERPHYHAIVFGLGLKESDKQLVIDCWKYTEWTQRTIRKRAFGTVTPDSIEYVSGYITKKLSGELAQEEYHDRGREPVFKLSSLGIGKTFVQKNEESLRKGKGPRFGGVEQSIPRYYLKKLGITSDKWQGKESRKESERLRKLLREKAEELEIKTVEESCGMKMTKKELYRIGSVQANVESNNAINASNVQKGHNTNARINLRHRTLKD